MRRLFDWGGSLHIGSRGATIDGSSPRGLGTAPHGCEAAISYLRVCAAKHGRYATRGFALEHCGHAANNRAKGYAMAVNAYVIRFPNGAY